MLQLAQHIVSDIPGINLEELAVVDFDGRVDTKYIFPTSKLEDFFNKIKNEVVVLQVGENKCFNYRNVYFDQKNFEFFRQHHAGYLNRIKVRSRAYGENGPFVFEIKTKTNKSITVKERISLPTFESAESQATDAFLRQTLGYGFENLPKRTGVNYSRFTFANKGMTEKFTLDLGLTAIQGEEEFAFTNLVIAEVKQEQFKYNSVFVKALKELKIQPGGFSKYCASVIHFNPQLKKNRFKPVITKLKKLEKTNGVTY